MVPPSATFNTCKPRQMARIGIWCWIASFVHWISRSSRFVKTLPNFGSGSSPKKIGLISPPPVSNNPSIVQIIRSPADSSAYGRQTGTPPASTTAFTYASLTLYIPSSQSNVMPIIGFMQVSSFMAKIFLTKGKEFEHFLL